MVSDQAFFVNEVFPDPFKLGSCALRVHVLPCHRNRLCDVRPCRTKRKTAAAAAAVSDSETWNLGAVLRRFACVRCPEKLDCVATSRVPSHAGKRGDNSLRVLFGGDSYSARRSDDVPGFVGVVRRTKRAQEWGSPHVRALLQTTMAVKSGRQAEAAC